MSLAEIFQSLEYGPTPESTDAAKAWLAQKADGCRLFIDGCWHSPETDVWFDSINPANNDLLARVAQAGPDDVNAAVEAARKAQPGWAKIGGHGRARYLYALARLVQKHERLLAVLETMDNGKTIRETRDIDAPLVARHFLHHAGWAQLMETEFADMEPVGVAGQIIPWNFPLLMLAWKVAPALATGNTVVLKPAEFTSLTALLFAELCQEANLPPGVLNIVTGNGSTGELIVRHDGIDKLAFTGSTEVGRLIRKVTAGTGKKLTLELGGKSPFIVFDDADLDSAVEGVVDAIWLNQGQVCCAGSRLLLQEGIADAMIDKVKARMETLRMGDPLDKAMDLGAIVAPVQLTRIKQFVAQGVAEGAKIWQPEWACPTDGYFYPPTLFTDVTPASAIATQEIFGPVLAAMSFRTPADAVSLANNSRYGLAASVWSENISLALDIAPKLKSGVVWINSTNLFDATCGFGGYRESGFGREGGREGLYEYMRPTWEKRLPLYSNTSPVPKPKMPVPTAGLPPVDHTAKMYVGGKQQRPDGGNSRPILAPDGTLIAHVGDGNRKDIRNAVEAARKAEAWSRSDAHNRAQILYYVAENLHARAKEFSARIARMTGISQRLATREIEASLKRLFSYAAWTDKYDGAVHTPPLRGVTLAMNEPLGIMGIVCPDDAPLLGFLSLVAPAVSMGNRVVVVPSERHPLAVTDFYQVLDTSDMPDGVINIVTGDRNSLAKVLAEHDELDGVWYVGPVGGSEPVERASIGNLKRTWVNDGRKRDWFDLVQGEGIEFLRRSTQVKNIWIPYGE